MKDVDYSISNELIANFLGYKYKYLAERDYSDIGGLDTNVVVYSKEWLDKDEYDNYIWRGKDVIELTVSGWDLIHPVELMYHSSYDWLIPVLERIEEQHGCIVEIAMSLGKICKIYKGSPNGIKYESGIWFGYESNDLIESIYNTIIEYIKWYNEKNNIESIQTFFN